jgi:Spy/CpxP family protein refolding chaperone
MKAISKTMLVSALLAGAAFAQPPQGPPDAATMVQMRVEHLTALLNLTTAQVTQATTIFTNAETAASPIRTSIRTYRTSLQTAVQGNQLATIDQLAAQIGAGEGQIVSIQGKADAAFYAILTADQQTKLAAMPGALGGGGRGMGPGPRMRRQN